MKIYKIIDHETVILTLEGKLMGIEDTQQVHDHVKRLVSQGFKDVILDLKPLQWLNSSGMGVLIASFTTLRKQGGNLVLANVGGKTRELLNMTHLDQVFPEYDSVEHAMEALARGRASIA